MEAFLREVIADVKGEEAESLLSVLNTSAGVYADRGLESTDLPAGWSLHQHDGRVFYHHPVHGSQWTKPGDDLPDGWTAHVGPCGKTYYHHSEQGSSWEIPRQ